MRDRLSKMSNSQVILTLVLITIATMFISTSLTQGGVNASWWANWFQNISADMVSAIITFLLLVLVVDRRDKDVENTKKIREQQDIHKIELKQREDLAGKQEVLNKMMAKDLLRDINLNGFNLEGVNLRDADLSGAKLREVKFAKANLIGASLKDAVAADADFRGAKLAGVNLEDAILRSSKFDNANLSSSNMKKAFLAGANFSGTDLTNANLCEATLDHPEVAHSARFNEHTTLPNGDKWVSTTHMPEFTNKDCDK
jgi:hypothetical protein